ncbi:hypothetical protein X971_1060 [Agrobacterium tumefaciens LBA4213 (Ach5)]|nr:hypothetical protein X971_1060 [Agrobacterium tumefaciens LBA4213 (Ach5)]
MSWPDRLSVGPCGETKTIWPVVNQQKLFSSRCRSLFSCLALWRAGVSRSSVSRRRQKHLKRSP